MSKDSPAAPDYVGAATATGEQSQQLANQQTYANRPTINTPWGTQTWDTSLGTDPATGANVTRWESNVGLTPETQNALDSQMRVQQGRSNAAEQLLGHATNATATPMQWGNMPQRAGQITAPSMAGNEMPQSNIPNMQYSPSNIGVGTVDPMGFGNVQTQLNQSPSDYRERAQDAVWALQQPALTERREGVETQLANQGLARGSEAWNREARNLSDNESRARLMAISEGRSEANQMFGQDLESARFGNQGQAQQFGQGVTAAGFNNAASAQQSGLNRDVAAFENAASSTQFQQMMQRAQAGDQQAMQQLQAQISAGAFNNTNRQGAVAEAIQMRGQPLNELNALLSGSQVSMPQFPSTPNASTGQTTDFLGALQSQYGAQLDSSNAKNAGINSALSSGAMAAAMYFSDARLKEDIEPVGILASGLRVVHYRYRGCAQWFIGVLAQEALKIIPDAVAIHPSGFLMVDYSKVR
jgi:hypothetical protein